MLIECIAIIALWVAGIYVFAQTSTLRKLIRLIRQPGRMVQSNLATSCVVALCVMPGVALLIHTGIVCVLTSTFGGGTERENPLTLLAFSPYGTMFAMCAWAVMAGWLSLILARPESLYRGAISLVPMVILSLVCLTFSVGAGWETAKLILPPLVLTTGPTSWEHLIGLLVLAFLLYIPTAPLAGLVLLITHVARMLPSGRMSANGGLEDEGDMS